MSSSESELLLGFLAAVLVVVLIFDERFGEGLEGENVVGRLVPMGWWLVGICAIILPVVVSCCVILVSVPSPISVLVLS